MNLLFHETQTKLECLEIKIAKLFGARMSTSKSGLLSKPEQEKKKLNWDDKYTCR